MRVGGFVMLALAALGILESVVASFWLDIDRSPRSTAGTAFFEVLLGVAMLQGSNAARKVVLGLTGLSMLAVLGLMGLLVVGGFGHLWPIGAASLAVLLGVFVLNISQELSRATVIGSLLMIVVGWAGSVVASILLAGTVDLSTVQFIQQWSVPERSYENAEAGITMRIPPSWVALKEDAPIGEQDKPLFALINTEVLSTAMLRRETRGSSVVDTLDYFLDSAATAMRSKTDFHAIERTDTRISGLPARRMKASWREEQAQYVASLTAWRDSDVFFVLEVRGPRLISRRLEAEVEALEQGVQFSAPWSAFLRDKAGPTRTACPLLTDAVVVSLARRISRDAPPETYCREAYALAFVGLPLLDEASRSTLSARMSAFFAVMPARSRDRFGAYVERLRASQPTSQTDDQEMMRVTQAAVLAMAPPAQEELRRLFAAAVESASFGQRIGVH